MFFFRGASLEQCCCEIVRLNCSLMLHESFFHLADNLSSPCILLCKNNVNTIIYFFRDTASATCEWRYLWIQWVLLRASVLHSIRSSHVLTRCRMLIFVARRSSCDVFYEIFYVVITCSAYISAQFDVLQCQHSGISTHWKSPRDARFLSASDSQARLAFVSAVLLARVSRFPIFGNGFYPVVFLETADMHIYQFNSSFV